MHFYNTANEKPSCESLEIEAATVDEALANDCWPEPEGNGVRFPGTVGGLNLSEEGEAALVAYLKTLTDTNRVIAP